MSYRVNFRRMDLLIKELMNKYRIFAPKRLEIVRWNDSDAIRYADIDALTDIVHDMKSDFSPKEILHEITQKMSYFYENTYRECEEDEKGILLFARPCDINGIRRLDTVFLKNGNSEDIYYRRKKDKLKIIMLECSGNCTPV